jgi:protein-arginine deiminase
MDPANRQWFDANPIMGPHVQATTEWLAVGHIDEYTMFIPAPNTARGYVCMIASPMRAWNQLVAMNGAGGGANVVFQGRTTYGWQTTVGAIVGNGPLGTLQQQVQARIDQGRNEIKAATGLTDADFIELPVLFEHVGGGYLAAYNPGVVNMVCLPAANGTTYLIIPDPEGPIDAGGDIWQQDILAQINPLFTAGSPVNIAFTDVFYSYHDLLGEAHCGTNTIRIAPDSPPTPPRRSSSLRTRSARSRRRQGCSPTTRCCRRSCTPTVRPTPAEETTYSVRSDRPRPARAQPERQRT